MTMPFGTNALRDMSRKQLAAKYAQVRAAVLATEWGHKFADAADFDAFSEHYLSETGIRRERNRVMFAFGQLHLAHTKSTFSPPSPETLQWGGLFGGEVHHDSRSADAVCWDMLGKAA